MGAAEEEGEAVEQERRSYRRHLLGTDGPMEQEEGGAGLGVQQLSVMEEEGEGEAGDDGDGEEEEVAGGLWWEVEEEAELPESPVWRAAAAEELRRGPLTVEGEEGLLCRLWTGEEEEEAEQSCGEVAEVGEGLRHEKEVVEVLQDGDKRHHQVSTVSFTQVSSSLFKPRPWH